MKRIDLLFLKNTTELKIYKQTKQKQKTEREPPHLDDLKEI